MRLLFSTQPSFVLFIEYTEIQNTFFNNIPIDKAHKILHNVQLRCIFERKLQSKCHYQSLVTS